jgi:5'-nucleotidase
VSGINRGSNLGTDIFYSGTVAAAREACFQGVGSIAVSLHVEPGDSRSHFETAAVVARRVAKEMLETGVERSSFLNVNVPNVPQSQVRGIKAAILGRRIYHHEVVSRTDPRGKPYYWIGGKHLGFDDIEGSDGPAIEEGWATVTSMVPARIGDSGLQKLRAWTDC